MSRFSLVGFVVVLVTGCVAQQGDGGGGGGSGSGGGGGGSGSGSGGGGGGSVTPKIGAWNYAEVTPVSNTCNPNIQHGEAGNFAIDAASLTSFHVVPNDGTDPFTCTLASAGAFDCPDRAAAVQDERPTLDAVLTVHVIASGTFSDAAHATGAQHATVDCAGTQCALLGALPCTFAQNFAIVAL